MSNFIAVLDVGKTNKKVLIYDENLNMVDSVYKSFVADESKDIHYEQTKETAVWFFEQLKSMGLKYNIASISITTHGATFVCVNEKGELTTPTVAYTTNPGQDFQDKFFEKCGEERALHKEYATCNLGSLTNLAKGIKFVKDEFAEQFNKTECILNYPQYFGFLLTDNYGIEPTFLGCHSYLWDFKNKKISDIAEKLGIVNKLPNNLKLSSDILGEVKDDLKAQLNLSEKCIVSYGIHDSNASLVPYLLKNQDKNFILNSTGTWCVAMCPSDSVSYTENELDTAIFYNVDAFGEPVKTAIFMGGEERSIYASKFKEFYNLDGYPDFKQDLYDKAIQDAKSFILPGVMPNTGPFPKSKSRIIYNDKTLFLKDFTTPEQGPDEFEDPEYAYAVLNASLAIQTSIMLKNIGLKDGMKVYIEGGFRYNSGYHAILSCLCPTVDFIISGLKEATSYGAALLGKAALSENGNLKALENLFEIETTKIEKQTIKGLEEYKNKFLNLLK